MEGNSITLFENLCRIFEMRIKLDKEKGSKTSLDVFDNYEKYSKKIDTIYNTEFQKELKSLISPAVTLEKEEDRLRRLIRLLEERLDKRIELEDRFYNSTGRNISGLQIIVSDAELSEKKERLSLITNYLETNKEIEDVTDSINKLKISLDEEENKKTEYEVKNKIMEDELYSSFISIINNDEYYKNISEEDINSELENIRSKVSETKETLDITKESIGSLVNSGLEEDYTSYIEEAEKSYYLYKNREIMLKIYRAVISFEDDFKQMYSKREMISGLLEEKKILREELNVNNEDELLSFEKTLLIQLKTLDNEREILENITNYTSRINFKEERLIELNELNNNSDVLVILREYGLIDTYEALDIPEEIIEEDNSEEYVNNYVPEIEIPTVEESVVEEFYDPYRIVEIKDYPRTLNVGLARLKGESVREKVNKKLNPKDEVKINDLNLIQEENKLNEDKNITIEENKVENTSYHQNEVEDILPVDSILSLNVPEEIKVENVIDSVSDGIKEATDDSEIGFHLNDEIKAELPVWELPTEMEKKPTELENPVSNLPVWDNIMPIFNEDNKQEEKEINNIDIFTNPVDNNNANLFWVPVSDSKLETKDFPNINIPINNNFNRNDNFGFPTIKSEGE